MNLVKNALMQTAGLRLWSLANVPMIFWTRPRVVELSAERSEVMIPLNRRTKNHLNSMYFGVLTTGADIAAGILAQEMIRESGSKISLVFKDLKANFLKRPEADTHFVCEDGKKVKQLVNSVVRSGERMHRTLKITAFCPKTFGAEPVAEFALTLSLKPLG